MWYCEKKWVAVECILHGGGCTQVQCSVLECIIATSGVQHSLSVLVVRPVQNVSRMQCILRKRLRGARSIWATAKIAPSSHSLPLVIICTTCLASDSNPDVFHILFLLCFVSRPLESVCYWVRVWRSPCRGIHQTDMIFVKYFTPSDFPKILNLPEKNHVCR